MNTTILLGIDYSVQRGRVSPNPAFQLYGWGVTGSEVLMDAYFWQKRQNISYATALRQQAVIKAIELAEGGLVDNRVAGEIRRYFFGMAVNAATRKALEREFANANARERAANYGIDQSFGITPDTGRQPGIQQSRTVGTPKEPFEYDINSNYVPPQLKFSPRSPPPSPGYYGNGGAMGCNVAPGQVAWWCL